MDTHGAVAWSVNLLAVIGLGFCIGAGGIALAGALKGVWLALNHVCSDLVAWKDLREAVDEWKQRHPDKAARYEESGGPWRSS